VRRECRLTYRVTRSPTSRTVFSEDTYPSAARLCWMLVTRRGLIWPSVERLSQTSSRNALSLVCREITNIMLQRTSRPPCSQGSGRENRSSRLPLPMSAGATVHGDRARAAAGSDAGREGFEPTGSLATLTVPSTITAQVAGPNGAHVTYRDGHRPLRRLDHAHMHARVGFSSASFDVVVIDTTPPVIHVPAPISVAATSPSGAVVTFTATATDIVDETDPVTCTPASGSGSATVTLNPGEYYVEGGLTVGSIRA
jgi:hypothetical protein